MADAGPLVGPCTPWCTPEQVPGLPAGDAATTYCAAASSLLFAASGRQFRGTCSMVLRPCERRWPAWYERDRLRHGRVVGGLLCTCAGWSRCGCGGADEVSLGHWPITEVVAVKVDGAVLPVEAYALQDRRWLVRLDGKRWPCCQDMAKPDTEADTWSVSIRDGLAPPPEGALAARALALELFKADPNSGAPQSCLPEGVTQLVQQGVTASIEVEELLLAVGSDSWGIPLVDAFLRAHNPRKLQRGARVARPGQRASARRG